MKIPGRLPFSLFLMLSIFALAACSVGPRPRGQSLYPAEKPDKGYSSVGRDHLYEDDDMRITIRHLKKGEADGGPVVDTLIEKGYTLFRLSIDNKSTVSVMYNTAYTVLTSDALDYRKPLDFTDLYDITGETGTLFALKGKFYDLNTTVGPGGQVSRLLIFRPLDEKAEDAELDIKDIYVGTGTRDVSFPFTFKGDASKSKPAPLSSTPLYP